MSGIYIHIPFCLQRCHYCDFYSTTNMELTEAFTNACIVEIENRAGGYSANLFDTIYFGGGTPSALSASQIGAIITSVHKHLNIDKSAEITLEANPDDISRAKLLDWKGLGINRLSIGVQSFRDSDLKQMHRRHSSKEATDALNLSFLSGFENISMDLIYGLPDLKLNDWEENMKFIKTSPVSHLSAYHLTIEPGTVFNSWMKADKIRMLKEDDSLRQYELLCQYCEEEGYEHYEISNFAKNLLYSRHNIKYWQGDTYIGFGPAAHSFNGQIREWNPSSLKAYIEGLEGNKVIIESEIITQKTSRNELIMTGLRTQWGISKEKWNSIGIQSWQEFVKQCDKYIKSGDIILDSNNIRINPGSWFVADGIIADLFIV